MKKITNYLIIGLMLLYSQVETFAGGPGSGRHKSSELDGNGLSGILFICFIFLIAAVVYALYSNIQNKRRKKELYNLLTDNGINSEELELQINNPSISVDVFKNEVDAILSKKELYSLLTKNGITSDEIESQIKNSNIGVDNFRSTVKFVLQKVYLTKKYGDELGVKILNQEFFIGMTEEQLIDSKGEPTKIETEILKTKTKKIYIYGNKNSGDVFNFVDGKLERFKDR